MAGGLSAEERKALKREQAELRQKLSPWRKQLVKTERVMAEDQARLADIENALSDSGLYEPARKAELQALLAEQASVRKSLDAAEASWLETSEALEDLESRLVAAE